MDAVIIDQELIAPARLRELSQRNNGPSARRLAAQMILYFGSAVGLVLATDWWLIVPLVLLSGVIQFGMFGLLHEACHNTVFTQRGLNRLAGWLAALAQPMSPALMRAFHFEHHRHTHELAHDPELAGLEMMASWPRGLMWLVTMTGITFLIARTGWTLFAALVPGGLDRAWERVLPFVRPAERRRIGWEARLLLAIHAGIIAAAILWLPGLWWVYLGMALGHMFLAWYVTCEHRGLPLEGTILERTRTLLAPGWVKWLVWNMPYHAEHHAWPAVPWHALPAVHAQVREHLVHLERPLYLHLHGGQERPRLPADSGS
jgi:fatty acid desaturase